MECLRFTPKGCFQSLHAYHPASGGESSTGGALAYSSRLRGQKSPKCFVVLSANPAM